jgi:hypothetical protein
MSTFTQDLRQNSLKITGLLDQLSKAETHPVLIQSSLSAEQEARLRAAFEEEPSPATD